MTDPPTPGLVEAIAPRRLGRDFRWLLGSTVIGNAGDGILLAAGPLLLASLTRDPFIVSLGLLSQYLPSLLLGVLGGAFADRFERRRLVATVDLGRAIVLVVLAATVATGVVVVPLVLGALFLLGAAETFADSASTSIMPRIVGRSDLGAANARMQGAFVVMNQLVAPPIGAFLFVIGMALPFASSAACFALGAVLVSRIVRTAVPPKEAPTTLRGDIVEGIRWLFGHPPMRTLALTVLAFNVTYGAAWGVLVLYATDQLGMDEVGFGLLTTAIAIGGIAGTLAYGRLERRFSLGDIMRAGLLIETGTHLSLALTTLPGVALATMVVFGAHASVWGTTSEVVRQRAVPDALLGRVTGVYRVASVGGLVVGVPLGGLLAGTLGITAPFWFGFLGSAVLVVVLWRQFDHIAHAADEPGPESLPAPTLSS